MVYMMNVHPSLIQAIGYDKPTQTLFIMFRNGKYFRYFNVPEDVYELFVNAKSIGTFFHKKIKGSYLYEELNVTIQ